jgi:hypothetical protein
LSNRIFDYIDPWGEIISSTAWAIRASCHSTLGATPVQLVFGRDMIFNIKTIIDWRTVTARKQKQVIKDNLREIKVGSTINTLLVIKSTCDQQASSAS